MANEEMRMFGYVCPKCGKAVLAARSVFALEASNAEVECDCGGSALRVENLDGQKFRLTVPCGICGGTHTAECEPEHLLHGPGLGFGCPETKQICCYAGSRERVEPAVRELEILCQKYRQEEEPEAFLDSVIMYEVLSELKEIASRPDGITCGCGSSRYGIEVRHAAVDLVCRDCGAKLRIPAATDEDLDQLCCHYKLVIPGKKQ